MTAAPNPILRKSRARSRFESVISFALAFGLAWLLVIKADPLGFDAASKAYAENLFYRIVGASDALTRVFYRGAEHGSNYGQKNTALVLLQDDDLKFTGDSWPVPFGLHDRVVRTILDYSPKAIFVDISFTDPRQDDSIKSFAETLSHAHEKGIPIFFSSLEPFDDRRKILPELKDACAKVVPAYRASVSQDGVEHSYILSHKRSDQPVINNQEESHCGILGLATLDSPALALYREHVRGQRKILDTEKFKAPMEVFWASGTVPEINHRFMGCEKKTISSALNHAPSAPWWLMPWDLLTGNKPSELKQECPHTPAVYVKDLLVTQPGNKEAQDLFRGKLVIYGAHIKGSGDEIVAPTYEERVPGVLLHAMALDNLLVFGEDYKSTNDCWEWLILGVLLLLFWFVRHPPKAQPEYENIDFECPVNKWSFVKRTLKEVSCYLKLQIGAICKWLALNFMIVIPLIFLTCYATFYCFNVAPLNWVKFIGFAFSYELIDAKISQSQYVGNFFNWLAALIVDENKKGNLQ